MNVRHVILAVTPDEADVVITPGYVTARELPDLLDDLAMATADELSIPLDSIGSIRLQGDYVFYTADEGVVAVTKLFPHYQPFMWLSTVTEPKYQMT